MDVMFKGMLDFIFGLEDDLKATADLIKVLPFSIFTDSSTIDVANTVKSLSDALQSIGCTLLVFFFFYGFLKKTIMFEFVNWENVVKVLLRFLVAKFILQNCHLVLEVIAIVMNGITDILVTSQTTLNVDDIVSSQAITDKAIQEFGGYGLIEQIFCFMKYALAWLIMMVVRGVILLVVYGRFIEICIYTAIAPIPIATLVDEDSSQIAKKFFQGYTAVLLQGVIIMVMCFIYVGLVEAFTKPSGWEAGGDLLQYIMCSLVLLLTLLKSGNWAKQILGA